jgi:hypothetical protein
MRGHDPERYALQSESDAEVWPLPDARKRRAENARRQSPCDGKSKAALETLIPSRPRDMGFRTIAA